jgi:hypothetical protein
MSITKTVSLAAVLAMASGAMAQSAIWTGTTLGGPTFNRPTSFTAVSTGSQLYHLQPFYVSASGEYVFETDTAPPSGSDWDGFILVYANAFNPLAPLDNLIAGDDDYTGAFSVLPGASISGTRASRIILGDASNFGGAATGLNLTAGVQYYAINTAWTTAVGVGGDFTSGIGGGPGAVTLGIIPAPGAFALLGMGGLLAARRRR